MKQFEVLVSCPSRAKLRELTEFHFDLHYRAARQESPKRFVLSEILDEEELKCDRTFPCDAKMKGVV